MQRIIDGKRVDLSPEEEFLEIKLAEDARRKKEEYIARFGYIGSRKQAYPSIADQLDLLWHSMDEGKLSKNNQFYKALKKVKDEHPKP